jgi:hypothetical protein
VKSPVAIVTASWGSYWKQFGHQFVASIRAMQPFPAEVIIVTDQDIKVPEWIRVVPPRSDVQKWDWFNEGVEATIAEWVMIGSVDDPMFWDGLADINLTGDLVSTTCHQEGHVETFPGRTYWDRVFLEPQTTAVWTGAVFRRDVFLRFPWRRVVYSDWMQLLELRYANAAISFDRKPRFIHRWQAGSHSYTPSATGDKQIRELKRLLVAGGVQPGIEWPPKICLSETHELSTI